MEQDEEEHLTKNEARAGNTPGIRRYLLAMSLALAVILFGIILFNGLR